MRLAVSVALLALLALRPAVAADGAPDGVRYSPLPQIALSLPKAWLLCDKATGKVIDNAADPNQVRESQANCTVDTAGGAVLLSTDPEIPGIAYLYYLDDASFTLATVADDAAHLRDVYADKLCAKAGELLDGKIADCRVTIGPLAGHTALLGTATV